MTPEHEPRKDFCRVGEKPGKFEKTHWNGKNWFLPEKMGKTAFFQNTYFKSMLNYWQKNNGLI